MSGPAGPGAFFPLQMLRLGIRRVIEPAGYRTAAGLGELYSCAALSGEGENISINADMTVS